MPADEWAREQFGEADLKDERRTRRLLAVAAQLAENPSGTLPQAMPEWKDLKAAYRLFDLPDVTFERVLQPHWLKTREACLLPGQYLWIEDTTTLDFSHHPALTDIGRIGDDHGRGFFVHSTLALRVEWVDKTSPKLTLLGLAGQSCWVRSDEPTGGDAAQLDREKKKRRLSRPRESQRWARVLDECPSIPPQAQCIYVADRESDIYEVFGRCRQRGFDFLIRANQARALAGDDRSVFQAASQGQLLGQIAVPLRSRPGQAGRTAVLEVRTQTVKLRGPYRPGGASAPVAVHVVDAQETGAPAGVEPIRWVLLTSLPVPTSQEAVRAVSLYARRWLIEEYHKALKSGAQIERTQLEKRRRIEALLGILAVVALRLLDTKLLVQDNPDQPITPQTIGPEVLQLLETKFGRPETGWTHRQLLVCIARLGGFLARKHDGNPGWQTIWRGWHRLLIMTEALQLHHQSKCG